VQYLLLHIVSALDMRCAMQNMISHREILDRAPSPNIVAMECGVSAHTVRSWKLRDRIPAEYWICFFKRDWANLFDLANYEHERMLEKARSGSDNRRAA
jgi:hypothetical protein